VRLFVLHNFAKSPVRMHAFLSFCINIHFLLDYTVTLYHIIYLFLKESNQIEHI